MNEIAPNDFDYSLLDAKTKEFLEERANIIYGIQSKSAYEIGKQLAKAQKELSTRGYGCFEEWYRSLGFKKTKAYEYINHYNFVCSQNEQTNIEKFESLPKVLQAQVAKPSANPEVNQAVFNGDIKTHKEYKELERQLKLAEAENKKLFEEKEQQAKQLLEAQVRPPEPKPIVVEKEVIKEVVPEDYKATQDLNKQLLGKNKDLANELESVKRSLRLKEASYEMLEKETSEALALKESIEHLRADKEKLENSVTNIFNLSKLVTKFEDFFDEEMAPLRFKTLIQGIGKDAQIEKLRDILTLTENWLDEMNKIIPERGRTIIEGEIINE